MSTLVERELIDVLAEDIDVILNGDVKAEDRQVGFVMLVFPFDDNINDHACTCVSNGANHGDIVCLLKEIIARFEGQPEVSGNA